jgi:hypothetical protein
MTEISIGNDWRAEDEEDSNTCHFPKARLSFMMMMVHDGMKTHLKTEVVYAR